MAERWRDLCVDRLTKVVLNKLKRPARGTGWSKEFVELRQRYGQEEVDKVLTWYESHAGDDYVPITTTARQFRLKFTKLQDAINRTPDKTITISVEAKKLSGVMMLQWPNQEKEEELLTIQGSLTNFKEFQQDLKDQIQDGFAFYILSRNASIPSFVEWWMRDLHRLAWSWDDWDGVLLKRVWRPDSPHFQKQMRREAQEYCGNSNRWDKLAERINAG